MATTSRAPKSAAAAAVPVAAWLTLGLASALSSGCLPDPVIHIPDLTLPAATDGGSSAKQDGPSGDLGVAHWQAEGTVAATANLRAVWVGDPGVSEAFVVGQGGLIFHKIGSGAWQAEASGTSANLYAITARTSAEVYAVGEQGIILRRAGGAWKQEGQELKLSSALYGLTALPSGELVAVGDQGVVARRQLGGVWTYEGGDGLPGTSLRAVWGSQLDGMYAVGLAGAIVTRVLGQWKRDTLPVAAGGVANYYAVVGAADQVHIAGEYGTVLHRAVDRWLYEKLVPPLGMVAPLHLYALSLQDGELFVAGAGGTIEHLQSGSFAVEASGTGSDLYSLSGAGLRSLLAVGAQGTILRRL